MQSSAVVRENAGLLARTEREVLVWLANRMPAGVNSDHLTILGAGGTIVAAVGFGLREWQAAATLLVPVGLAINWFGDSLDGTLARVRNQQRPRYGYYVDHVLDSAGMLFLFGGMALGGLMTPTVALVTLVAYYFLSIEVYLATHALGTFQMSFWKIGPTELRILLVAGALAAMDDPFVTIAGARLRLFDVGGVIGAAGLMAAALTAAVTNTRALYRQEPLGAHRHPDNASRCEIAHGSVQSRG